MCSTGPGTCLGAVLALALGTDWQLAHKQENALQINWSKARAGMQYRSAAKSSAWSGARFARFFIARRERRHRRVVGLQRIRSQHMLADRVDRERRPEPITHNLIKNQN